MKNQIVPIHGEPDLPKGINRSRALPDPTLGAQWDSIGWTTVYCGSELRFDPVRRKMIADVIKVIPERLKLV